jgi:hypothetical protein
MNPRDFSREENQLYIRHWKLERALRLHEDDRVTALKAAV